MAVRGELRDMDLSSIISINCNEMNQARLLIRHQGREASIFFQEGNIVHMSLGSQEGEEVIDELLRWEEGAFELEQGIPAPRRTVTTGWSELLLEGMQRLDEGAALEASLGKMEVKEMAAKKRSQVLADTLSTLLAGSADIQGAAVVSQDGLVMTSNLPKGADETQVGASTAALLGLSMRNTPTLGRGNFVQSLIQGDDGNIILVGAGDSAIFVGLTPLDVNLGMVFLEAKEAAAAIAKVL